jgi:dephospho-CoA kinase
MNYLVTGLICSGKSTFLDIAKEYSFDAIKSDDIVSSLYNDESVVHEIEKHLNIKSNQDNLQAIVKKLFFTSKKNREIIEAIFHPIVHEMIKNSLDTSQNLMIELPPIINNHELFLKYKSIYIHATKEIRIKRFNKRKNIDSTYFDKINAIQSDFELIKEACDLVICNDNDTDTLNKHFEKGIIIE